MVARTLVVLVVFTWANKLMVGWDLAGRRVVREWRNLLATVGATVVLAVSLGPAFGSFHAADGNSEWWILLAMALVFQFAFHPTVGAINRTLAFFGIPTTDWLKNPDTALFALGVIGIWQAIGLSMVLFIAGAVDLLMLQLAPLILPYAPAPLTLLVLGLYRWLGAGRAVVRRRSG